MVRILLIHAFKCTVFRDAVLDSLQNNIKKTVSDATAAPLRGRTSEIQGQSLHPEMSETTTYTPKTHENSPHGTRWDFVCFIQ